MAKRKGTKTVTETKPKRDPGRPKKPDAMHRLVTLRMTDDELTLCQDAATADARPTAQWMRVMLLKAAKAALEDA